MPDLVLTGGTVHDGTGGPALPADIEVTAGVISRIRPRTSDHTGSDHQSADRASVADMPVGGTGRIDATGLVIAPGFVDIHTHSDLTLLSAPTGLSKLRQGVTTEVVGNCGLGLTPRAPRSDLARVRSGVGYLDLDPAVATPWESTSGYLAALEAARPALNVATFAAHLALRSSVIGLDDRGASPLELDSMRGLLADALDQGAVGLSTGLVYAPICYADTAELTALAQVVASRGRLMAWHVRDYSDELLPSVTQAIDVARATGVRTQVSHLVGVGRRNWGMVRRALDLVDAANAADLDVGVDVYPYLAGNAPLCQLLPAWAQQGGPEVFTRLLTDPQVRADVTEEWLGQPLGWDEIVVNTLPQGADLVDAAGVGLSLAEIGARTGRDGAAACLDLLSAYGGEVMMVAFGRSDADLRDVLTHPAAVVASDGQALDPTGVTGRGLPHPRSYGTFPRYLSRYVGRSEAEVADGIRRCTSAPAARVGLAARGRIAEGYPADLVLLDLSELADEATFQAPQRFPRGIRGVVVGDQVTVDDDRVTEARAGRALSPTPP